MLKKTLSAVTAIVIGVSGLNADVTDKSIAVSIDQNAGSKKGIVVEAMPPVVQTTTATSSSSASASTHTTSQVVHTNRVVQQPTAVQVMTPAPSSGGYDDTIVYASGAKNNYLVGESIKIKLQLKRNAYIYFWTVGSSGNSYRILPNSLESYNKYTANTAYVVPERSASYDFVSDRAGVEQVYVLATSKKINQSKLEAIFNQRAGGVIPMATNKSIKNFVTKDIQVIARNQKLKYDIASFQIQVHEKNPVGSVINITVNH